MDMFGISDAAVRSAIQHLPVGSFVRTYVERMTGVCDAPQVYHLGVDARHGQRHEHAAAKHRKHARGPRHGVQAAQCDVGECKHEPAQQRQGGYNQKAAARANKTRHRTDRRALQ